MKVAFQMDPISSIDINADSTFRLAEEAQERNYQLFFYTPDKLASVDGKIIANGHDMYVQKVPGKAAVLSDAREICLSDFDVIWLRQDPPFDMHYITTTHLLGRLKGQSLVVNDPFWVRKKTKKLFVLDFKDFIPPTMITSDLNLLRAFKELHRDIILKPLYGNGGAGIFRLDVHDRNLKSLHELFSTISHEPLIAQKFIPDVAKGDKRIILVDGIPIGAINRVPEVGETRSNLHAGGKPEKISLNQRDIEICDTIGPLLRKKGQIFAGIDVIGEFLTEINLTSPTGIQELERFDKINVAAMIWDKIEERLK